MRRGGTCFYCKTLHSTMPSPSSSSSSASGSASPSRSPSPILDPRTTEAHPKKKTARPAVADGARNEGTNPSWAFKPPPGATALDHTAECGPFDWDAVEGEDFELWLVRVPADVRLLPLRPIMSAWAHAVFAGQAQAFGNCKAGFTCVHSSGMHRCNISQARKL